MMALPESNVRAVAAALDERGLKNPAVQVGVLCCVAKESGFVPKVEYSYRGTDNGQLRRIFGARLRPYDEAALSALKQDDIAFYDVIYGGRFGNSKPGDGFKYRGRGFNQITFAALYSKYGKMIGVDLLENPDELNEVEIAAKVCSSYFEAGFASTGGNLKRRYGVSSVSEIVDPKIGLQVAVNANAGWGNDTRNGDNEKAALRFFQEVTVLYHKIKAA